jgi:hypothetical protein
VGLVFAVRYSSRGDANEPALEEDGYFTEETKSIVVRNGQIKIDDTSIDLSEVGKYYLFLMVRQTWN